jgi:hypothetical protein
MQINADLFGYGTTTMSISKLCDKNIFMSFCSILSTLWSQVVFHNLPHFGKRAGQKVQRKIAVAVQNVRPLYFLSRSFALSHKNLLRYSRCFYNQIDQGAQMEGLKRED